MYSALLIGAAVYGAFLLGTGNATLALFAVALAGTGLLTTVGVIVSMDTFGPVSDNAQGIAEMSGDVEGEGAQVAHPASTRSATPPRRSPRASRSRPRCSPRPRCSAPSAPRSRPALGKAAGSFSLSVDKPNVLVGVIIGAAVVFLFAGLLIRAVGRAAQRVVFEVRNQFRDHPGIMDYTEKPEYGRVVDICTRDSLRELATPGLLAVLTPIAVGFAFGYAPLGAYLVGAIAAGVLMAVFLANSGGAWDNAKKLVEDGHYGGKGSEAHAATVIGDTVGDPFKDTAGPAINPLIKVMNLVVAADRHQRGEVQPQHRAAGRRGAGRGGHRRRRHRDLQAALRQPVRQRGRRRSGRPAGRRARTGPRRPRPCPGPHPDSAEEQTPQATGNRPGRARRQRPARPGAACQRHRPTARIWSARRGRPTRRGRQCAGRRVRPDLLL